MQTPQEILDMLEAVREDGHDLVNEDPNDILEAAYTLGYEHESAWFYEWDEGLDPASDLEAKPKLDIAKYTQAIVDLDSPPVLKLGKKRVTYDIETGETENE